MILRHVKKIFNHLLVSEPARRLFSFRVQQRLSQWQIQNVCERSRLKVREQQSMLKYLTKFKTIHTTKKE